MIAAAALAIGLLLVLTGLLSARIPGGATFARPGIDRSPVSERLRAFLLSPIHPATWYANGAIVLGLIFGVIAAGIVFSAVSAGLSVLLAGVGFLLVAFAIEFSRLFARIERWRVFVGEPMRPPPHPYRPLRGGILDIVKAEFGDENRWRDVLYVAVNLPLSVIEGAVVLASWSIAITLLTMPIWYDLVPTATLPEFFSALRARDSLTVVLRTGLGLATLPFAASLSQLVIGLHRAVVAGLLCTSEERALRRQLEQVRRSRTAVLDVEASELNRIERDLHDGAQQRLVALTIDLGRATEKLDTDPGQARELILEGQEQARQALAEIRSLVRGIAPAILIDRGLVAAIESISGRGPVPTVVLADIQPGGRLPPHVERTAYFIVSEALANVAKHSGANRCEVRVRREGLRLVVEVWDDGSGGAAVEQGGGLAGLASRVSGVDGSMAVSSPAGGPTIVRAEIPLGATG